MTSDYIGKPESLPDFWLWEERKKSRGLFSFTLELTARCNHACRHCYINQPAGDISAKSQELDFESIKRIVDEAVELGAVWCLITGGEPLLRPDFEDIYMYLKRKGILVSVFTNASLITEKHIELFKKYPPRSLEVTVYGVTEKTFGAVTGTPQYFDAFMNGVQSMLKHKIKVNLKTVVIKSNRAEFEKIAEFCRTNTSDPFRFDPFIHLRFDRDEERNKEIRLERLSPDEITALEQSDPSRNEALMNSCEKFVFPEKIDNPDGTLFGCGAGLSDFVVSSDGHFLLCGSLYGQGVMYDLKNGSIRHARETFVPAIRAMRSNRPEFLTSCATCEIINLCTCCPAHALLETGAPDLPVDYFCSVAKKRRNMLCSALTP